MRRSIKFLVKAMLYFLPKSMKDSFYSAHHNITEQKKRNRVQKKMLSAEIVDIHSEKKRFNAAKYKRFNAHVLTISHSNYTLVGGVEKYIFEQVIELESRGIGTLLLHPVYMGDIENNLFEGEYVALVDGVGEIRVGQADLGSLFDEFDLKQVVIHHLKNWPIPVVKSILESESVSSLEKVIFLHDFYTICPRVNRVCMNTAAILEYGSEDLTDVQSCSKTWGSGIVADWCDKFNTLFNAVDRVLVPSQFVADAYLKSFPHLATKIQLHPLLVLDKVGEQRRAQLGGKLRVAFLGYKVFSKGAGVWQKLISNHRFRGEYSFYHFGSNNMGACPDLPLLDCVHIDYHFIEEGIMGATNILKDNNIDIVLLWSTVPETYSFTLHEALSSGAYILTNQLSGNIHAEVTKRGECAGKVFTCEADLMKFLYDIDQVRQLVSAQRNCYKITPNFDFLYKPTPKSVNTTVEDSQVLC